MSDRYLIDTVVSDLKYLDHKVGPETTLDDVRRDSVILRRLLVNGDLKRAWRVAGMKEQFFLKAARIEYFLEYPVRAGSSIELLIAGGANVGPVFVGVQELIRTDDPSYRHELPPDVDPNEHRFALEAFLQSGSFYVAGQLIRRREVIQYVANKLGGAHLDFKRKTRGEEPFRLLDQTLNSLQIDIPGFPLKNAIHFEMLSIGQALTRSDDTRKLMAAGG